MSAYAAVVGIPPALVSEKNATSLGRIEQRRSAPKMYMTVTALRGWRLPSETRPIQREPGRTPSRATAKTRREAATIAMLVFCGDISEVGCSKLTED